MSARERSLAYQYVVLRCVPRPDREEFVNVGVVLHCQAADFLAAAWHVDPDRLRCLAPDLDVDQVREALEFTRELCAGGGATGGASGQPAGVRFGFLKAPRSTVVQPGQVHGGLTADPAGQLQRLVSVLVG